MQKAEIMPLYSSLGNRARLCLKRKNKNKARRRIREGEQEAVIISSGAGEASLER